MRIAYLSYEFPPDTASGGIGTYTYQVTKTLKKNWGCDIEIFSASPSATVLNETLEDGIILHRIKTKTREEFRDVMPPVLLHQHTKNNFDLIESPEYGAEGLNIKQVITDIPFIVKLHTPSFLVKEIHHSLKRHQIKYRLKNIFGFGIYKKEKDAEYHLTKQADALSSPSSSLAGIISEKWEIANNSISIIPNTFVPENNFLEIPIDTQTNYITYIGRLEGRKGVHLLAEAIPHVLESVKDARIRFIGRTNTGPGGRGTMLEYLKNKLFQYSNRIEFIDHVPLSDISSWLKRTDICIFPSLWENFPNVCLEAMSAGRGIVASKNGGMFEMLHDIRGGELVNPYKPIEIENALIKLLNNPKERMDMGERCRKRVIEIYSKKVPELNIQFYQSVIDGFKNQKLL